MFETFTLKHI